MAEKVLIIGGGAAGMACAVFLARSGMDVVLAEKNEKTGKKLFITGKGRCNFTNACGPEEFLGNIVTNKKFLYSAAYSFTGSDTIGFFEKAGLKTKVERGNRAFPASDHSSDVIRTLNNEMKRAGVRVMLNTRISRILTDECENVSTDNGGSGSTDIGKAGSIESRRDTGKARTTENSRNIGNTGGSLPRVIGAETSDGDFIGADYVVLATGGLSYPSTGSTGDGFRFAEELGIKVTAVYPSLTSLTIKEEETARALEGLSLRNVSLTVKDGKKEVYSAFGEMLFTHSGISGPIVLSASAYLVKKLEKKSLDAFIDLKPALETEQLDARIVREFEKGMNRQFINSVSPLFPAKLIPVIVSMSGIPRDRCVRDITRKERTAFAGLIKHFPLTINGHGGFNEAVITQGGISVSEVDPHTMRLKKYRNLYAAGEMIDTDALTGGFNLQIAWSTAYLAAEAIRNQK